MDMTRPGMDEIAAAVALLHAGERNAARAELLRLWHAWATCDAPLQRCTIAHFLADLEAEPLEELAWDLRALEAVTEGAGGEVAEPSGPDMHGLLPSLHLNVADAMSRTGDVVGARRHVALGFANAPTLASDGYGRTIRFGLERLSRRLEGGG